MNASNINNEHLKKNRNEFENQEYEDSSNKGNKFHDKNPSISKITEGKTIRKSENEFQSYEINLSPNKSYLFKNEEIDENIMYHYCVKCNNYLIGNEYEDHLLSHELEEAENNSEDIKQNLNAFKDSSGQNLLEHYPIINNTKENIQNEIDQERHKASFNHSHDEVNYTDEYDMIEDKDNILKEIEEEEIFKRKFLEKKNSDKNSNSGIFKKTVSYLFDFKYRRVPPIVRIVGAIFDRSQILRLAEDELASRLVSRVIEGPKKENKDDEGILLTLIPEITLENEENLPADKKDCVICGDSYEKGHKISNLPCLHTFHSNCIKEWFKQKNMCPICKYEITIENFK